jgi:hypothetical protein
MATLCLIKSVHHLITGGQWWSEKAKGKDIKDIFYKLPEHLILHFSVYKIAFSKQKPWLQAYTATAKSKALVCCKCFTTITA